MNGEAPLFRPDGGFGRRRVLPPLLFLLCLFLGACQTELYQGLTENNANELLSSLLERGIPASKLNQGKNGFAVAVDEANQLRALSVLRDLGLPKPDYEGLGKVFRKEGMMSSPTEERARLAYALSQEISASCARLDGVVDARAHVVLSERDAATGTSTPASAAVMLRYAPDAEVARYIPQIQKLVVQSVPDVNPDRVSVLLFPVLGDVTRPESIRITSLLGLKLLPGSEGTAAALAALLFILGLGAGAGAVFALRGLGRLKTSSPARKGES
ncbi:MAG: type III secretion inner membrane ring lipoprotein SctJ [Deltaproteobacteria bacterium]|jgi:type III secretion protein J|nr:type III secretion inner membrane ring lipoprotein SctJ [Deltaproteobacteria bacterium]